MFITFEGIEGSGKTTQIHRAAHFLAEKGFSCVMTREPGGTEIGVKIRRILLDPGHAGMDPTAELLLYLADRIQHLEEVVLPALARGETVLCDRFTDATVTYQGYGRGLDIALIHALHSDILKIPVPDLTILLDLPVETGLARAWERIEKNGHHKRESRFEEEVLSFHKSGSYPCG
ncbi:MAG: dTMP kinase [Deltaproteobacteria bacterium]|nr:dTMP kinase [Deltaproteobacteria bacterium]